MLSQVASYYIGVDLGQAQDYTAIAVLEEPTWVPPSLRPMWRDEWGEKIQTGWVSPANLHPSDIERAGDLVRREGRPPNPPLSLRHLERLPLGTRYPDVVERVAQILASLPEQKRALLVDATGVGGAVLDSLWQAGTRPYAITITGGGAPTEDPRRVGFRVPKRDLVSAVQILLQNHRLTIAKSLPEADTLRRELRSFRVKIDPKTAHDSYEHWRERDHDDLVLAVAMACWFREFFSKRLEAHYVNEQRRAPM